VPIEPNVHADETLSQRIASELRTSIHRGDYPPGHQLPSGRTLLRKYGVARQTVQNAFDVLRGEGLIVTRAGAGTFVRDRPTVVRLARNRVADDITGPEDVIIRTEPADQHSADALGLQPGEEVLVRERVVHADGAPVRLATSRLPTKLAASLAHAPTAHPAVACTRDEARPGGHLACREAGPAETKPSDDLYREAGPADDIAPAEIKPSDDPDREARSDNDLTPADVKPSDGRSGTATETQPGNDHPGSETHSVRDDEAHSDRSSELHSDGDSEARSNRDSEVQPGRGREAHADRSGSEAHSGRRSKAHSGRSGSEAQPGVIGGHVPERFVEYVSTRPAKPAEASRLRLAAGAPVLCVTRIAFDQGGTAVELNDLVLSGERYQLVYELPAD
jgi:DNA-binding GntR family transcriptional regulator